MKNILMLCIGFLFMVSCEKDLQYEIVTEQTKYTLNDQGKVTISCKVTPEDFDISNLKMGYYDLKLHNEDPNVWSGADIMSVTKDAQTPGKWSVVIGLTAEGGKPYTPKPEFNYEMDATVDFYALKTGSEPIHTTKFQLTLDIKSAVSND